MGALVGRLPRRKAEDALGTGAHGFPDKITGIDHGGCRKGDFFETFHNGWLVKQAYCRVEITARFQSEVNVVFAKPAASPIWRNSSHRILERYLDTQFRHLHRPAVEGAQGFTQRHGGLRFAMHQPDAFLRAGGALEVGEQFRVVGVPRK